MADKTKPEQSPASPFTDRQMRKVPLDWLVLPNRDKHRGALIVIEQPEPYEKTPGGIILPSNSELANVDQSMGVVRRLPQELREDGEDLRLGDIVLVGRYAPAQAVLTIVGDRFCVVAWEDILAIIRPPANAEQETEK